MKPKFKGACNGAGRLGPRKERDFGAMYDGPPPRQPAQFIQVESGKRYKLCDKPNCGRPAAWELNSMMEEKNFCDEHYREHQGIKE